MPVTPGPVLCSQCGDLPEVRLGVFDSVRLRYATVDDSTRNVLYELEEVKPISLSVLAGYGSYELLRGGLEFEHRNMFGLAHDLQLRGVQSFKSSSGDLLYTVPQAFGENVNLFLQGSGLRREEVTFTREEYGGSVGLQKLLVPLKTDFTIRYEYEILDAQYQFPNSTNLVGTPQANSAAFVIQLVRDLRDNPLLPRRGLKLFTRMEFASASLGGNVDYQRLLFGASYHRDLSGGRLLHLGAMQGGYLHLGRHGGATAIQQALLSGRRQLGARLRGGRGVAPGWQRPAVGSGNLHPG